MTKSTAALDEETARPRTVPGHARVLACPACGMRTVQLFLYAKNGWLGQYLEPLGIKVAFTPLGVLVALIFIGLPFVVRTVQPVLEDLDTEELVLTLRAAGAYLPQQQLSKTMTR